MQVQSDVSNQIFSVVPPMTVETVSMPDDYVSVDSFFSVLRQAVKDHWDNLWPTS